MCRREAEARGRPHRLRRHDRARRRQPHRLRRAGDAGRDAAEAQAAASADHAAVHRARGERPAWRPRTGPGRPRRRDDVLQRRQQARRRADHRRGRPGELGRRDQGQGVARRRRARRRASQRRWWRPSALAEAQRGGWFGKVVKPEGKGTSNVGIFGGKDGKPAGDATNVVTDYVHIKGEARSPDAAFATAICGRPTARRSPRRRREVKDAGGETRRGEVQPARRRIRRSTWPDDRRPWRTPSGPWSRSA